MSPLRHNLLLLQLPRLDPDITSPGENVMLAAACLQSALVRTAEGKHWRLLSTPATHDTADNATLLAEIVKARPAVVGATLYLWNIERTLRLLAMVKQHLPQVKTVVGGPEVARGHPLLFGRASHFVGNFVDEAPDKVPDKDAHVQQTELQNPPRLCASARDIFPVDVAVIGEGEAVFPGILSALRRGTRTNWTNVAWMEQSQKTPTAVAATAGRGPRPAAAATEDGGDEAGLSADYADLRRFLGPNSRAAFGTRPAPVRRLEDLLPPADHPILRPDAHGMAYLETNRGCPMRCAFCCYNLRRKGWSSLPPQEVERRIRVLRRRGATEIRLVDPTFNAHPRFRELLGAMQRANRDRKVKFFVELRADTLTEQDAAALAAANIAEAEVGVQSTDPAVLRCIHRPTNLERTLDGIARLQRHGIKPTIDFMYGLPRQGMDDIRRSLEVLQRFPRAHQQFLPTLLLPGTELRDRAQKLKLRSQPLPPYRVQSTDRLGARQLAAIEALAQETLGAFDTPTRKFVGRTLPDLFGGKIVAKRAVGGDWKLRVQGSGFGKFNPQSAIRNPQFPTANPQSAIRNPQFSSRQAVIFRGPNLFAHREAIGACIRDAVRREPDILWQFVLAMQQEEPLDLLDGVIATIRALPSHWLDRLVSPPGREKLAARRVFVLLPRGKRMDAGWCAAAEELLGEAFH